MRQHQECKWDQDDLHPFCELALKDVHNSLHIIRCLQIDSIGQSNLLSYESYMEICQILRINPSLVQQPTGDHIHILIGLDALNLLGHPVTVVPDQFASQGTRKLCYPTPHFDNLRLFSTPLNAKMFLAGVFRSPINQDHLLIIFLGLISLKWGLMVLHARLER